LKDLTVEQATEISPASTLMYRFCELVGAPLILDDDEFHDEKSCDDGQLSQSSEVGAAWVEKYVQKKIREPYQRMVQTFLSSDHVGETMNDFGSE
jgi:hypothetical protein